MKNVTQYLAYKAYRLRVHALESTTAAGSGHPTSCLSAADIVATLFFDVMHIDFDNLGAPTNDRFVLSKGHAAPLLYAAYAELGLVPVEELKKLRSFDSVLEGHPTPRLSLIDVATGSLGMGLSYGVGMAIYAQKNNLASRTYVLMGDGETAEGSVWEAAALASFYVLDNLVAIVDVNRLGQSGPVGLGVSGQTSASRDFASCDATGCGDVSYDGSRETASCDSTSCNSASCNFTSRDFVSHSSVNQYAARWSAFGWHVVIVDGHDIAQILSACAEAREQKIKPTVILARTVKGYGLASIEGKEHFHGRTFSAEELPEKLRELRERFAQTAALEFPAPVLKKNMLDRRESREPVLFKEQISGYALGEKISTRQAAGRALAVYGAHVHNLVCLDADVKNSTYTDLFEKNFPERFVECFIAEQAMVGIATGLVACGAVACAATFGAFFTRAYDQIRMAAIGRIPLRLIGTHAGVAIGQDGPSQMALEDIALMRCLPDSIVLCPADGVSAHKLVACMLKNNSGISYLRAARSATPVIYDESEEFFPGGCKVLKQSAHDCACIIAVGVTVYEALEAYETLARRAIFVSVIDCYSIKPLDMNTIKKIAHASGRNVVAVEDHYAQGGLGEAICHALAQEKCIIHTLAVNKVPRSGKPEELARYESIDAQAIIERVLLL